MPRMPLRLLPLALCVGLLVSARFAKAQGGDPGYLIGTSTIATTSSVETDCNFNGTAVACPGYIWFIAVGKLNSPNAAPVTIYTTNQHIQFTADGVLYNLSVPDGQTTYDASATTATTTFTGTGNWSTLIPPGTSGNQFFAAYAWPVPCPGGLPGSVKPVAWTATFYSDKPGVTVSWTWSAAAYTQFASDLSLVEVKAVDDNHYPPFANSHHAGTPENYRSFVTGGATGGGGSNWTGSLCSTHSVPDLPISVHASSWGRLKTIYR
jgi:hypothetical protein